LRQLKGRILELTRVIKTAIDENGKREELKAKRNLLFEPFLKNPVHTRLALEIKIIDDQIVECTKQMERNRETEQGSAAYKNN
jgi:hypothetical protein